MLLQVEDFKGCPMFIAFVNSAHADEDQRRSMACNLQVFQGGLIDHTSWVPNQTSLSSTKSENNCHFATIMRVLHTTRALCDLIFKTPEAPYTVPICMVNTTAISMNESDAPTRKPDTSKVDFGLGKKQCNKPRLPLSKLMVKPNNQPMWAQRIHNPKNETHINHFLKLPIVCDSCVTVKRS